MDKNTGLAIGLSTVVLVGALFIQSKYFTPVQQEIVDTPSEIATDSTVLSEENTSNKKFSVSESDENLKAEEYTITTNKARITLSNVGGDIIGYELLEHQDTDRSYEENGVTKYRGVEMADNISESNRAFSLSFGDSSSPIISDIFSVQKIDDYTIGFYRTYKSVGEDGKDNEFTLVKEYSFKPDDYMFKMNVRIDYGMNPDGSSKSGALNIDGFGYTLRTAPQIGPHYDPKQNKYESRQFMAYTNGKRKYIGVGSNQIKEYNKDYTWTGIAGKYFEIIAVPEDKTRQALLPVHYSTFVETNNYANAQVMLTRGPIGENTVDTYYFYVGPRNEKELVSYNAKDSNAWGLSELKLNESAASSWLSWIEIILKYVLEFINKLVHNWGLSIIIMTIIIKAAMYPLTRNSSLGTLKMQELQPQIQALQNKYKDNPQKLNAEMSALYQKIGYNPLSGCLPLVVQMFIILALYQLFNNYFEFRGSTFIPGWIPDLSAGDSVYTFKNSLPFLNWNQLRILPIIYVITQLVYGKISQSMNPANAGANAQQMKMMMYGMPIFFFFIFYNAPAGLLLYWTTSNIIQMIQQILINNMMKKKRAEMNSRKNVSKFTVSKSSKGKK